MHFWIPSRCATGRRYLRRIACPQYGLRPRCRLLAKTQSSGCLRCVLRWGNRLGIPEPKAGEILIQVYATGGTPTDKLWYTTSHYADGSTRSKAIPGHEFSGIVAGLAILADEKCR